MSKFNEKLHKIWSGYWKDDEQDTGIQHLSQHDKRFLLYGGFLIGVATLIFLEIGIFFGDLRASRRDSEDMQGVLDTIAAYMATATEDEYDVIAQSIRRDLVYSEYNQDVKNFIQYVPNTAKSCALEQDSSPERINLIFLNTGEAYGLDIIDKEHPVEANQQNNSTILTSGYDEISGARIFITKLPNEGTGTASFDRGRGIVSVQKMKSVFCDDCIQDILNTVENIFITEAVIYDTGEHKIYPITEGELQIGDSIFSITCDSENYEIEIAYKDK